MDCDHASGIGLVKDAEKIMVSEEEFNSVKKGNIRYGKINMYYEGTKNYIDYIYENNIIL